MGSRSLVERQSSELQRDRRQDNLDNAAGRPGSDFLQDTENRASRVEPVSGLDQSDTSLRSEVRNPEQDAVRNQSSAFLAQVIAQEISPQETETPATSTTSRAASLYQSVSDATDEESRNTFVGIDIVIGDEEADAEYFNNR